jgi:hypothetical protein
MLLFSKLHLLYKENTEEACILALTTWDFSQREPYQAKLNVIWTLNNLHIHGIK